MRLLLLLLSLFCSVVYGQSPRPNVIILLADDLGYGDLACYGNPIIQTPNLHRMAQNGLRFTNAHSSAPVCSPSRAGLLTGRIPTRLGILDWIPDQQEVSLSKNELTIASLLKNSGYQTGFFGKWHLNGKFNNPAQPQPNDHGFDYWFGTQNNAAPSHQNPINFVRNGQKVAQTEGYSCQIVADEAIRWLQKRDPSKPFYQHICFHEPHEPVASPEEHVKKYGIHTPIEKAMYLANVENLDRAVGRILESLEKQGLAKNTLVIFTSDNGPETLNRYKGSERSYGTTGGLHGMKLHLYEGGTRVPCLMQWKGKIKAQQTSDALIWNCDFLPTIASLTGAIVPKNTPKLDGENIANALNNKNFQRKTPLFWTYYNALDKPKVALQVGQWKLLGWSDNKAVRAAELFENPSLLKTIQPTQYELFDTKNDRNETKNQAQARPQIVAKLQPVLHQMLTDVTKDIAPKTTRPNIVIFLSDDQGWGDLSINGNRNLNTPNVDNIGRNGAQFSRFYVQPVCSPTRAELLTGRYHPRAGVFSTSEGGERIHLSETTLADIFKKAGYATGAFGKWHSGMQYPYHPNARGFDEFYGFCSGHWGDYFSPPLEHNGQIVQGQGFTADDFTNKALSFIEKNQQQPFLVYLPFNTPHSPMQVPDEYWTRFKDKPLSMQAADPTKEDPTFTRAALAMCENIDWNVGRVMARLRQLGLEENTIVLYFNDNGPNAIRWNGGMKSIKGSTDEGGVRSPLLIQYPKVIKAGTQINQVAGAIDLLPTLADLAGIQAVFPKPLDGISLKNQLQGNTTHATDRLIFSHWNGRVSVRTDRYRLDHAGKLYDMTTDLAQITDIAAQQSAIHTQLTQAVTRWKSDVFSANYAQNMPFTVGHPQARYTELPARDAKSKGNIQRSNRHPNSTFFTHWTSTDDAIEWDVEVLESGDFDVELYYTCHPQNVGATIQLSFDNQQLSTQITEAHDPPLRGMERDKIVRIESYVKDFKPLKFGKIHLPKGTGKLTLKALKITGKEAIEVRTLLLTSLSKKD